MPRSRKTAAADPALELACACATVRQAARTVTQLYDHHLRQSDIEAPQFALLSVLQAIGPSSQAAIGQRLAMDKTTLSRNLALLKKKGWIETAPAEDGRERRYVLSAAGRERVAAARPAWRRAQEQLRASMTTKEWNVMFQALRAMTLAARSARV